MFRQNRLKQRILAGEKSFGTWLQSGCPTFAEIASTAGFDFFVMDQEHGPGGLETAMEMARAAACAPATAMVRVPSSHPTYLKRLIDAGIEGILVPMVESAAEAEQVVKACRYPPRGNRGNAADIARCSGYGLQADYLARADDNLLIAVQIETAEAVAHAAEIAAVDGVDLVFIGPTDLSGSIGLMGQTGRPSRRCVGSASRSAPSPGLGGPGSSSSTKATCSWRRGVISSRTGLTRRNSLRAGGNISANSPSRIRPSRGWRRVHTGRAERAGGKPIWAYIMKPAVQPPSTIKRWPVMYEFSGATRKRTPSAISSTEAGRPNGICAMKASVWARNFPSSP
jgi:4-hydroxy-2-oxoheptanedioate aldolase